MPVPESEWKSAFDDDEIREVREAEAGRFAGYNIRKESQTVPDGFQVETEPTVPPEDTN